MKSQSQLVLTLKTQIAATLKLIALKIKRYVLQLIDLEKQLEEAMAGQLETMEQKAEKICKIIEESGGGYVAKLWQKHSKSRIYISKDNGRRLNGQGYIDLDNNFDCSTVDGWANHWATAAVNKVCG